MPCETATLELQVTIGECDATLDMQVIVASGIPPEIFVYKQLVDRDAQGCYKSEFCSVAAVFQMTEVPATEYSGGIPMKRLDNISLVFDNFAEIQDAIDSICTDVDQLLEDWNKKVQFTTNPFIITFPKN